MALKSKVRLAKMIGKRIRAARIGKGLSLKHFEAIENSIDRHSLSRIEKGTKIPNLYTVYRIAFILDISLEELFSELN